MASLVLALLTACTITPPTVSTSPNDASNPEAAEAATAPLRPGLFSGAKTYLSPREGADAQQMQHGRGGDMKDHASMEGMAGKAGALRNPSEQAVTTDLKQASPAAAPTSEQLQSTHPADYTCPMHREVHRDQPGQCPKCGMTLVSRESLEKSEAMKREP